MYKNVPALIGEQNTVGILFGNGGVIKQTTRSQLVGMVSLISNIGKGLGLALGISAYSFIVFILELVHGKVVISVLLD